MKHHLANARSKVGAETTAQLVWILSPRLPEPEEAVDAREALAGPLASAGRPAAARWSLDDAGPPSLLHGPPLQDRSGLSQRAGPEAGGPLGAVAAARRRPHLDGDAERDA